MDLQLNIAICDDETYYRNHIEALVREYLTRRGCAVPYRTI